VNGAQQKDINILVSRDLLLDDKVMVLRHGKSNFKIVEVMSDEEVEYSSSSGIS